MGYWLYQMTNNEWSTENYRYEVWEGNNTTWDYKTITPVNSSPVQGDMVIFYYAETKLQDPGIYGWAVILKCENKEIYFRPAPPSDYLKMSPLWNEETKRIISSIKPFNQGNMYKINFAEMKEIREEIAQFI